MAPDDLRYTNEMPALVTRVTQDGERTWGGLLEISGRTGAGQPISMRSLDGGLSCLGTYETTAPLSGRFVLWCDTSAGQLRGQFRVQRTYRGNNVGIAVAEGDGETLFVVFGLDRAGFRERMAEFRANHKPSR